MRLLQRTWLRRCVVVTVLLLLCGTSACAFFRIHSRRDVIGFMEMSSGFHPAWWGLACRQFRAGDAANELIRRHPPPAIIEYGPYADYEYEICPEGISLSSLRVVAKDGRLIGAWAGSCTWEHTFFGIAAKCR